MARGRGRVAELPAPLWEPGAKGEGEAAAIPACWCRWLVPCCCCCSCCQAVGGGGSCAAVSDASQRAVGFDDAIWVRR